MLRAQRSETREVCGERCVSIMKLGSKSLRAVDTNIVRSVWAWARGTCDRHGILWIGALERVVWVAVDVVAPAPRHRHVSYCEAKPPVNYYTRTQLSLTRSSYVSHAGDFHFVRRVTP